MRIFLVLGLAALLGAACSKGSHTSATDSQAAVLTNALPESAPHALVLDVRTPQEFNAGHVKGAVNVPIDELALRISQVAPQKDAPIAVHCQSGGRSARAKRLLDSKGYTHVEDLGSLAHARQVVEGSQ